MVRSAWRDGRLERVYADETRPRLQGAKLTAWECVQEGIPVTVITDNMAAHCMQLGMIDAVVVGADRIAANGDAANKIGTYSLALDGKRTQHPRFLWQHRYRRSILRSRMALKFRSKNVDPSEIHTIGEARLCPRRCRILQPCL